MRLLLVVYLVVLSGVAQAQVDSTTWNSLLNKITSEGRVIDSYYGVYMSLSNHEQVQDGYLADYISTVGGYDNQGQYQYSHVELVSEDWSTNADGNWDINQWIFVIEKDQSMRRAAHIHLVEDPTGGILVHERLPIQEGEAQVKLNDEVSAWTLRP